MYDDLLTREACNNVLNALSYEKNISKNDKMRAALGISHIIQLCINDLHCNEPLLNIPQSLNRDERIAFLTGRIIEIIKIPEKHIKSIRKCALEKSVGNQTMAIIERFKMAVSHCNSERIGPSQSFQFLGGMDDMLAIAEKAEDYIIEHPKAEKLREFLEGWIQERHQELVQRSDAEKKQDLEFLTKVFEKFKELLVTLPQEKIEIGPRKIKWDVHNLTIRLIK